MKKKQCLLVICFLILCVKVFSEENNAIIVDLFPMVPGANGYDFGEGIGIGISYERKLHQHFSILGGSTFSTNFKNDLSYSLLSRFRVYPFESAIRYLFTDAAIIYASNYNETENIQTLSGMASLGWNFILSNSLVLVPGTFFRHKIIDIIGVKPHNYGFGLIMGIGWTF
ncbi:MAG: hypothetical protein LBU89_05020 [Fibromonadaceae bacterium]|nr:hypothetical protein [Fibromonadaceae bacterium]